MSIVGPYTCPSYLENVESGRPCYAADYATRSRYATRSHMLCVSDTV